MFWENMQFLIEFGIIFFPKQSCVQNPHRAEQNISKSVHIDDQVNEIRADPTSLPNIDEISQWYVGANAKMTKINWKACFSNANAAKQSEIGSGNWLAKIAQFIESGNDSEGQIGQEIRNKSASAMGKTTISDEFQDRCNKTGGKPWKEKV